MPLPTSGREGKAQERWTAKGKQGSKGKGGETARDKQGPDFFAIMDEHHKCPPPCSYAVPSAFDPVLSRSPRVSVPKAAKTSRFMGDVDLYQASKGPGPGQYTRSLESVGFAGKDRSRRAKLPMERVNPHAIGLPPISARTRM
eukprot:CAMPEP_0174853782 /NCGR_PEP_ID=MMETSP1114-20130205/29569_1 /TAXON_ID=312471 /ORGANISM="Neobodo designis, Strain CCAP 1951/1" /LENGTH=142 /DNA_ID=CAMNT_0016088449 /DNA_START=62 /DNA_END=490 /DNA_ORIENTATION=+